MTAAAQAYESLGGVRHRHGKLIHERPHAGPHIHAHAHGHSHGLVDDSIKRSREGVRAVAIALAVLSITAAAQAVVFVASGSVALLADLVHNAGDAATAIPLAIAFALRSARAERSAGLPWWRPSLSRRGSPATRPCTDCSSRARSIPRPCRMPEIPVVSFRLGR